MHNGHPNQEAASRHVSITAPAPASAPESKAEAGAPPHPSDHGAALSSLLQAIGMAKGWTSAGACGTSAVGPTALALSAAFI